MSIFRLFNFNNNNVKLGYQNYLRSRIILKYEEQRAWISNRIFKKFGLPLPPKKPLNAFHRFSRILRPKLLEKQPNILFKDFIKVVADEWNKYDPEKKKSIQEECKLLKENYLLQIKNYKESITEEQKNLIKSIEKDRKKAKELLQMKKISLGYPKKPIGSFIKFMMEKQKQKCNNMTQTEWIRSLSREWKNISESDKEKYKKQFKQELDKYRCDIITWEKNMSKQGHTDILKT